jgi:hypothetical protein
MCMHRMNPCWTFRFRCWEGVRMEERCLADKVENQRGVVT